MVSIELDVTFFIQAGLFLILVYILNVLVYRPVKGIMEERERNIGGFRDSAASMEKEIEEKLVEYRTKIGKAKEAGSVERGKLKKEGLDREAEILSAAHADAQKTLEDARARIEEERDRALKTLRDMTEEMGRGIAEKVIGRPL